VPDRNIFASARVARKRYRRETRRMPRRVTGIAVECDGRFKLRVAAQTAMVSALGLLDQLGDENVAAATLQHAIDRLSCQRRGMTLGPVGDTGAPR
jgi:hypothetical protein